MEKLLESMEEWLTQPDLAVDLRGELEHLQEAYRQNPADSAVRDEIAGRFGRNLEFGTGGLRGVLGAGTNRMNICTVRRITQGLADYINSARPEGSSENPTVAIGYDNRNKSDVFTFESACVLLANNISVYVYPRMMPTPALSFAVRRLNCRAGIMITASHNSKEYNGYKVYGSDGCQSLPEEADAIAACIDRLDLFTDVRTVAGGYRGTFEEQLYMLATADLGPGLFLKTTPSALESAWLDAILSQSTGKRNFDNLSVVFTPLHGTGNIPVRRMLQKLGVENLHVVKEQEKPDENFTTCPNPNPEKKEALQLGLELCEALKQQGQPPDLLMATDPDADRVGVAVYHQGDYHQFTGNEVGVLLFDFICRNRQANGTMPERPVAIKTIVSTPMAAAIARHYDTELIDVLTGFKYIGEQIGILEQKGEDSRYIFGFEESCGYLSGSYVRDKDAINACLLIAEMAQEAKTEGITLVDRMQALYRQFGFYESTLLEFNVTGETGLEKIGHIMLMLRSGPREGMFLQKVSEFADYRTSVRRILAPGKGACDMAVGSKPIALPKADVLEYVFQDGSSFIVRPSGTEPKLKIYLTVCGETQQQAQKMTRQLCDEIRRIVDDPA